jgi:hypothetical protein
VETKIRMKEKADVAYRILAERRVGFSSSLGPSSSSCPYSTNFVGFPEICVHSASFTKP